MYLPIPVAARSKSQVSAAHLLGLQVRIPLGAWMSDSCVCCVLQGSGLFDGPIPRLEESYGMCVCVWHLSVISCNNNTSHLPWLRSKRSE
jgi:hypothetical protein